MKYFNSIKFYSKYSFNILLCYIFCIRTFFLKKNYDGKYVFLFTTHRPFTRDHFFVYLKYLLSGNGYKFVNLTSMFYNKIFSDSYRIGKLELNSAIDLKGFPSIVRSKVKNSVIEKTFNIEKNIITINDINIFPLVAATLSSKYKRSNFNYNSIDINTEIQTIVESCISLYSLFIVIYKQAISNNIKFRFIVTQHIDLPASAFKLFCDNIKSDHFQCITTIPASNSYYFDSNNIGRHYIISNLTKRKQEIGIELNNKEFESIKNNLSNSAQISRSLKKALCRKVNNNISDTPHLCSEIKDLKNKGIRIFVLFGHLFFDAAVFDSSPAFNSMSEWLSFTINHFISSTDDILILKPHPSESTRVTDETLQSFCSNFTLPSNIILLDPDDISSTDISELLDYALVWTSSVGFELSYLKKQVLICGSPVYKNCLNLNYISSKEDYCSQLLNPNVFTLNENILKDIELYCYILEIHHSYYLDLFDYNWNFYKFLKFLLFPENNTHSNRFRDRLLSEI